MVSESAGGGVEVPPKQPWTLMFRKLILWGSSAIPPFLHSGPHPFHAMIEALKSDEIVNKLGGRFKLTALIQRRLKELVVEGARPLVERDGRTDLELAIEEVLQDKITPDWSETGYVPQKNT